jgi:DtxR family Mn-dependent transcriptional regulator
MAGQMALVLRVPEEDTALLQYVASLGLEPGTTIRVEAVAPFQGPLTVRIGDTQRVLGRALASRIIVRPL